MVCAKIGLVQSTGRVPELEPALLTPARLLAWRRASRAGRDAVYPSDVIVTHQPFLFQALAPRLKSTPLKGLTTPLRTIERGRVGVALPAIGAPATAMLVDELAVRGARRIVSIDLCAGISTDVPSGTVVLVASACCGDGTSAHYAPGRDIVEGNAGMIDALAPALLASGYRHLTGRVWSTDAPYRETASLLKRARDAGAVGIDMETSALYAAGAATGVACASILVAADCLQESWQPPSDMGQVNATLRRVAGLALGLLRS